MASIEIKDLSLCYRLYEENISTLKEFFLQRLRGKRRYRTLWAVDGLTLDVEDRQSVGILGRNGSGKSSLLKVIAGVLQPTRGTCMVNGSVSALIELGAGFNAELTGRENVYLSGALMGLSRREIDRRYEGIVAFSELHDFMDVPVKNYSSGMFARLGFAVATDVDADVLLIDEILGVGDEAFQRKSHARIESLLQGGKTVVFVSHSAETVRQVCSHALVLDHGRPHFFGPVDQAIDSYHALLRAQAGEPPIALVQAG